MYRKEPTRKCNLKDFSALFGLMGLSLGVCNAYACIYSNELCMMDGMCSRLRPFRWIFSSVNIYISINFKSLILHIPSIMHNSIEMVLVFLYSCRYSPVCYISSKKLKRMKAYSARLDGYSQVSTSISRLILNL
jgi:hypothetical protein